MSKGFWGILIFDLIWAGKATKHAFFELKKNQTLLTAYINVFVNRNDVPAFDKKVHRGVIKLCV